MRPNVSLFFSRLSICLILCTGTAFARADDSPKIPLSVPRTAVPIAIDGKVEAAEWSHALKLELGYEVEPQENIPAPVRTEVFITYSDSALLIAFKAYDPDPSAIRVRYSDRDKGWNDDYVGVSIDSFNDQRRAFEFFTTPLGVQTDAVYDEVADRYDSSWNAIWEAAGQITAEGFEAEIAIPFNQLRFQKTDGPQVWGIDAIRSWPRNVRHHIGHFPRQRGHNSYLSQMTKISGFEGVSPGLNLEVVPTLTGQRSEIRPSFPDGEFEEQDSRGDLGVSARWSVTPNISLQGTLNPDFSQVEADALQLDVNQQFALYYPETRTFFLEGAEYFNSPRFNLVHTRTIVDPAASAKVTGKEGPHTFGLFTARDEVTTLLIPGPRGSYSSSFALDTDITVGRYRYDYGRTSTVGVLFTDRRGGDYRNSVVSLDARHRFTTRDTLTLQASGSSTHYDPQMQSRLGLPGEDLDDGAYYLGYRHDERSWYAAGSYTHFGPDYRADLGFIPQVGQDLLILAAGRHWYGEPGGTFSRISLNADYNDAVDEHGDVIERELEAWVEVQGPLQSFAFLDIGGRRFSYAGIEFDQIFQNAEFSFRPNHFLGMVVGVNHGDWVDFLEARAAERWAMNLESVYFITRNLSASFAYDYSSLDIPAGRLFTAHAGDARIHYQFNTRTYLRAAILYTDITRDQDLFTVPVEEKTRELFTQLLFSYKVNPQTVLYLGYTGDHYGTDEYGITQYGRTFFAKIGYAWLQ